MTSDARRRHLIGTLLALWCASCGIEVGNPHGKKGGKGGSSGTTGAISLSLADAPVDQARHVYLNLTGMVVFPDGDDDTAEVPVALDASGKIDVLELNSGKSLAIATSQSVPAGSYAGVLLILDPAQPATVVDSDGSEVTMALPDAERGIYVQQAFDIADGEDLKLTLHIDLRRSIRRQDGPGRFGFGPVAHMVRQDDEGSLGGQARAEVAEVCAYLRLRADFNDGGIDRLPRHFQHSGPGNGGPGEPEFGTSNGGGEGGPGPGLVEEGPGGEGPGGEGPSTQEGGMPPPYGRPRPADRPQSYGPGQPFDIDADSSCDHAFATAAVADGRFLLSHLWPGDYQLAFYGADGKPLPDSPAIVQLEPGDTLELPPAQ
jgi:hypothetical protein